MRSVRLPRSCSPSTATARLAFAELGEAVGLGRGALYYHISSKEDLLYNISSHYMQLLIDVSRNIIALELIQISGSDY